MPAKTKKKPVKKPEAAPETVPEISQPPQEVPQIPIETPLTIEKTVLAEEEVPLERKNKFIYLAGIIFLIIVTILSALIFVFFKKDRLISQKTEVTPVPTAAAPSPVPFSPNNWTVEVLNGSGTAGVAKKAADVLSPLGFEIINIGNADKSDYTNIHVYLSSDLQKYETQFMEKIKSVYKDASVAGKLETSSPSARIIIGR